MPVTSTSVPNQLNYWDHWHRHRGASGKDPVHRESRETFLRELQRFEGRRVVVDLGCGQGHDVRVFAREGHSVTGIDFSSAAIECARKATRVGWFRGRAYRDVRLLEHDIRERLPFDDGIVDGVFSHLALHYFHDDVTRRIFAEIARITKPGGVLLFTVKSVDDPYFDEGERLAENIYRRKGHIRHFFTDTYTKELLDGWRISEIRQDTGHYASRQASAFITAVATKS